MTENRKPMPLLPEAKPDNQYPEQETILPNGLPVVRNVTFPTLTPFLPADVRTGMPGMIVAPGGAMHFLAHAHEGTQVCEWLNQRGIPAFLLKYRLIKTGDDFPECVDRNMADRARFSRLMSELTPKLREDAARAIDLVRANAREWRVDPAKIGLMGFSAGGMVTFLAATNPPDKRPSFAAPIYPGPFSSQADADVPPLFLLCAADDAMAVESCQAAFKAWNDAGVPAELHIFHNGGHGFGMNVTGKSSDGWMERLYDWMRSSGYLREG